LADDDEDDEDVDVEVANGFEMAFKASAVVAVEASSASRRCTSSMLVALPMASWRVGAHGHRVERDREHSSFWASGEA